jgi:hypothetical protein
MTQNEANSLVKSFFSYYQISSPGLNANNLGAATVGEAQLYFQFDPDFGELSCNALIYRFHQPPRPRLLEVAEGEATNGAEMGGGELAYQSENQGLYLHRAYTETLSAQQFIAEQQELLRASLVWRKETLDRVADALPRL